MFCSTLCMKCKSPKIHFVNHSKHHGICEGESLIPKTFTTCIHCHSVVFILNLNNSGSGDIQSSKTKENIENFEKPKNKSLTLLVSPVTNFNLSSETSFSNLKKVSKVFRSPKNLAPMKEVPKDFIKIKNPEPGKPIQQEFPDFSIESKNRLPGKPIQQEFPDFSIESENRLKARETTNERESSKSKRFEKKYEIIHSELDEKESEYLSSPEQLKTCRRSKISKNQDKYHKASNMFLELDMTDLSYQNDSQKLFSQYSPRNRVAIICLVFIISIVFGVSIFIFYFKV